MRAVAKAQPNIALVKYWGKRDTRRNLPAVGSISITLSELYTLMSVELDPQLGADRLDVNGRDDADLLPRVSRCLDDVLGNSRTRARVASTTNFPVAAGLASSASAFAALVLAVTAAAGLSRDQGQLARVAGRASGSAARSLYGGFVELRNDGDDIAVASLLDGADWPLKVVIAITAAAPKPVGSGEAMEISRRTSPFYGRWVNEQDADLRAARRAICTRDFEKLATVAEHNCLKMHSVMWTSRPAVVYWNEATLACMQAIRQLQAEGVGVFFTIDAGPQVKAICLPEAEQAVCGTLAAVPGVTKTMISGLGSGAVLVDAA